LKFEESNLIHIQTKDNLVILTHKTNTLIILTTFLITIFAILIQAGSHSNFSEHINKICNLNSSC